MDMSLNEVEAQARKAARGAGYEWGEAEEAGRAVRWLCHKGLDGCRHLAQLLVASQADGSVLCPIKAGITLADFAHDLDPDRPVRATVTEPLLYLAFAANAAQLTDQTLTVDAKRWSVRTDGRSVALSGAPEAVCEVSVSLSSDPVPEQPTRTRAAPSNEDWATLAAFAHHTYAPATEESRQRGAGAGLTDND